MNLSLIIACVAVGLCIGLLVSLCKLSDKIIDIQYELDEAKSDINSLDATINGNAYRHRRTSYTTYGPSLISRVSRLENRLADMYAESKKQDIINNLQLYINANGSKTVSAEELYYIAHGASVKEEEDED